MRPRTSLVVAVVLLGPAAREGMAASRAAPGVDGYRADLGAGRDLDVTTLDRPGALWMVPGRDGRPLIKGDAAVGQVHLEGAVDEGSEDFGCGLRARGRPIDPAARPHGSGVAAVGAPGLIRLTLPADARARVLRVWVGVRRVRALAQVQIEGGGGWGDRDLGKPGGPGGCRAYTWELPPAGRRGTSGAVTITLRAVSGAADARLALLGVSLAPRPAGPGPSVVITSPAHGATWEAPAQVTVEVDARAPGSRVAKVELYDFTRAIKRGEATRPPWRFTFTVKEPHPGALTAHVFDDQGRAASSEVVKYRVLPPTPAAKAPPSLATLERDLASPGLPGMGFEAVPSVLERPDGELLVAFYAGAYELSGDSAIYLARRPRGGTWSRPVRVLEQRGMPHGNPVLTHDERGTLTCFFAVIPGDTWEEAELRSSTSRDGGRTWSAPRAWPGPAHAPQDGTVPATKPLWLGKTLLLPLNGESFAPEPQRQWYSFFRRSEDGGATWQESAPIFTTPGNIQPSVLHLGGERLLAFLRPRGLRSKIWRSTSEDAGRTWSTPERTELDTPSSRNDAVRLPSGAIVIAWNDSPTERTPLVLALSKDGGRTFPVRRVVERGPIVYGYSALIAGADGRVHLVYNHNLEAIGHVAVDEAWFTAPPNPTPTVELDRALGGRVHRGPLSARVEAQDADGIARLELLLGHRVLAARQESAGDGNGAWTAKIVLPPGRHALRARATDRRGGVAYTPLTYLTVAP